MRSCVHYDGNGTIRFSLLQISEWGQSSFRGEWLGEHRSGVILYRTTAPHVSGWRSSLPVSPSLCFPLITRINRTRGLAAWGWEMWIFPCKSVQSVSHCLLMGCIHYHSYSDSWGKKEGRRKNRYREGCEILDESETIASVAECRCSFSVFVLRFYDSTLNWSVFRDAGPSVILLCLRGKKWKLYQLCC